MKRNEIEIEFTKDYATYSKGDKAVFKKSLATLIIREGSAKVPKAKKTQTKKK